MPLTFTDTPLYYKDSQGSYQRILSGADMTGYRTAAAQDVIDAELLPIVNNAGAHNSIYRGKYLGAEVTAAQYEAIDAGTFEDLYIGDYWTINNVNWRIAAFDYWLHCGDTECTKHHLVMIPETCLYNAKMNDSNIVTGAYIGSLMYTTNLANAKTAIDTAFGSAHILKHREQLANAVTEHRETGHAWVDSKVEIMNESMVYGTERFHNQMQGNAWAEYHTIDKTQLAIFRLDPTKIVAFYNNARASWWLRDVVNSTGFAYVYATGNADLCNASGSLGVRPAFGIFGS